MVDQNLVVVKGSGGAGLGDRICALSVGILYARYSNRALHVDWRDRAFESQNQNLFPHLLQVDGVPIAESMPKTQSVLPSVWRDRLDLAIDQLRAIDLQERGIRWTGDAPPWDREEAVRRYSIDVRQLDWPEQVVVIWSGASMNALVERLQQDGEIDQGTTSSEMFGKVLRESVSFEDSIRKRIDDFWNAHLGDRPSLGVHYRKTDEAAAARSIPSEKQYLDAVDRALAKLPDRSALFLATDNASVQQTFRSRYGADRVVITEKWLPESGQSIHKNSECPDGTLAAKDALVDVGLLARCDRVVLTGNSSFSSLAAWFSIRGDSTRELVFPFHATASGRILRALKRLARR